MHIDEYRKLAEVEDHMWYFSALNQRMLIPLRPWHGKPAQLLDAGCGTGGLIRTLSREEPKWSITGLDFSSVACTLARERTGSEILVGSITDLPFPAESFEILTCADVLSQVEDGSQALREFARVLRPGGIAVINVAAYGWMWSYHDKTCVTRHRYRKSELLRLVQECRLEPVMASYVNMLVFPLIIGRRKLFPPRTPSSDVRLYPQMVESFCSAMAWVEHHWLARSGVFPTGCSVFLAARKPQ